MRQYIIKRVLMLIPVMFLVSFMVFSLIRLIPGSVVEIMLAESGNVEDMQKLKEQLGLTKPIHEQYVRWAGGALRGDLGESLWTNKPVLGEIWRRVPVTAELAVMSMLISLSIAIPAGIISATRQDRAMDYVGRLIAVIGLSVPSFFVATVLLVYLSLLFRWIPPVGFVPILKDPSKNIQQFVLPALALGAFLAGTVMRMTRSSLLEVLRQDYVRTAWAKGLREREVILRHALKNATIPVLTVLGNQFGYLLGGTVIIETIFGLPGLGRLTYDSIMQRDYPQLQGNVLFIAFSFVTINLIVDLTYAWLDPRIRYQ